MHFQRLLFILYFHIHALRHIRPFLDSETSKTTACTIVGSILDYVNSILTGISSRNIHRLQHVQNSVARVITRSTTNTTSALNSLHWLPIQQRINFKLAILVHRSLHNSDPLWSMHVVFTTSSYAIASGSSASLCLPQSPLPTLYQHYSCLSLFSTCWRLAIRRGSRPQKVDWGRFGDLKSNRVGFLWRSRPAVECYIEKWLHPKSTPCIFFAYLFRI